MKTGDMTMYEIASRYSGLEVVKVKELLGGMNMDDLAADMARDKADERRSENWHQHKLRTDDGYYEACLLAKVDERLSELTQAEIAEAIAESVLPSLQEAYRNEDALQFGRAMMNMVTRYWRPVFEDKTKHSGDL